MNHQDLFKLLREVKNNVRCPQCGKPYTFSGIKIRGVIDSVCFLELNCKTHLPLVATVMIKPAKKEINTRKIDANDIIEVHKFLKNFQGGFESMFLDNK